jgi:DNA-directed RNA polymerase specialized sigma24 family protein
MSSAMAGFFSATRACTLKQHEHHERAMLMTCILNALPAEQHAAFILFELEGLSGAEIAQAQRVAVKTVWSPAQALKRIR